MPEFADLNKGGKKSTGAKDYTQEWRGIALCVQWRNLSTFYAFELAMVKAAINFKVQGKRGKSTRIW